MTDHKLPVEINDGHPVTPLHILLWTAPSGARYIAPLGAPPPLTEPADPIWVRLEPDEDPFARFTRTPPALPDRARHLLRQPDRDELLRDMIAKVDAGASLVHALYYAGADTIKNLPPAAVRAYGRACRAYNVTEPRNG